MAPVGLANPSYGHCFSPHCLTHTRHKIFGLNIAYKLKDSDELFEIRHGYQGAPITSVTLKGM